MSITEAQIRRALRHADIPWDREVQDPREDAWLVHDHLGLLGGRVLHRLPEPATRGGLLRRSRPGLPAGARARPRDRCDTTLYRLLAEQSPAGLEETLFAQVKDLIARKVVKNDHLHVGVIQFRRQGGLVLR